MTLYNIECLIVNYGQFDLKDNRSLYDIYISGGLYLNMENVRKKVISRQYINDAKIRNFTKTVG